MTTVATRDDTAGQELAIPSTLGQWAHDARQAAAVAQSLARTPFVPQSLRERPTSREPEELDRAHQVTIGNITAAILTGDELGLQPMAALRSIDVIQGTPAMRAMTMRAVALAHGHDLWLAESTATRAIVRGRRKGSDQVQESTWTLDRAKALGLAGKDNWRKQPAAMLVARATAECARLIAADALLGMPYSIEELDDGGGIDQPTGLERPVAAIEQPARRTAQRRTRPAAAVNRPPVAAAEPEPDPEPDFGDAPAQVAESGEESAPGPAPDAVNTAQLKKLHTLYGELEIADRDERLADVGNFIGRDVASSSELTKDEASRLIDDLERRISGMEPEEAEQLFGGEE